MSSSLAALHHHQTSHHAASPQCQVTSPQFLTPPLPHHNHNNHHTPCTTTLTTSTVTTHSSPPQTPLHVNAPQTLTTASTLTTIPAITNSLLTLSPYKPTQTTNSQIIAFTPSPLVACLSLTHTHTHQGYKLALGCVLAGKVWQAFHLLCPAYLPCVGEAAATVQCYRLL